jgi:hypothetical protein
LNPVDNTLQVVQQDSTGPTIKTIRIHTDDSFSASNLTPMTFPLIVNSPPRCDENGVVMFAGIDGVTSAQILRYQAGDAPAYTYDVVPNLYTLNNTPPSSIAVGGGSFWFFFFDSVRPTSHFGYSNIVSTAPAGPWSAVSVFLDSSITNTGGMDSRVVATRLPVSGRLAITMGLAPLSEGGQAYFETGGPAPAPPVLFVPRKIAQALVGPFQAMDPCCCPKQVGCVECSKDGRMYAATKTTLVKGDQ